MTEPIGLVAGVSETRAKPDASVDALGLRGALVELSGLSPQSVARLLELWCGSCVSWGSGAGVASTSGHHAEHVREFVFAPLGAPDGLREASAGDGASASLGGPAAVPLGARRRDWSMGTRRSIWCFLAARTLAASSAHR